MFGHLSNLAPTVPLAGSENTKPRDVPPPTPVRFPNCIPQTANTGHGAKEGPELVSLLRKIQRPADVRVEHLQALGLHVTPDAPFEDIVPDSSYLPSALWKSISGEDVERANPLSTRPLNNGRDSPGAKIYLERVKELSVPNEAAFRTIRRVPPPPGEPSTRLGNAYELFKYLELLAGFWVDTSQPTPPAAADPDAMDIDNTPSITAVTPLPRYHTTYRIGTGSQAPADYRNSLLAALTKLVAYDFGCNVSLPRIEPRLYISTSRSSSPSGSRSPGGTSSFPTNVSFVYRTPTARTAARTGVVEGPLAALTSRPGTAFATHHDSVFDLCREVGAALVTAQQRGREMREEKRPDEGAWWCHKPRWGGGPGGPIGRECEKSDEGLGSLEGEGIGSAGAISGIGQGQTGEREREKKKPRKRMNLYDNYRMIRPPSSTWDRKTKYMAIGRDTSGSGTAFDDVFVLSCLNHHVSVLRVRVPLRLLDELEGAVVSENQEEMAGAERDRCEMWRSRWFDMFIAGDRVEAMECLWGVMGWMMRKVNVEAETEGGAGKDEIDTTG